MIILALIIKKIHTISISIISYISNFMLLWLFISTVEIAFLGSTNHKLNNYNIFVLSNNIKSNQTISRVSNINNNYTDTIYDDSEDDDDNEDDEYYGDRTETIYV